MAEPTPSSSRQSRSPPHAPPSVSAPRSRSRSPSPSRSNFSYPQRYNLPPLRSLGEYGPGAGSASLPLPRLVLKTQHLPDARESNSRQMSSTGTAAAYSTLRSGSTSPVDYVGGGRGHGPAELGSASDRQRRYSGTSADGRSVSVSASEASLPPADMVDGAEEKVSPIEGLHREYLQSQAQGHDMGTGSGRVTPGAVLPPIPRTTKVVAGATSTQATPARRPPTNGSSSVSSNAKSRKSSCDLCHHRKIRCDQARPACGSCARKGHVCVYADETDRPATKLITPTNRSITVVSATNPGETTTITIPHPTVRTATSPIPPPLLRLASASALMSVSATRGPSEWTAMGAGLPTPISAVAGRERSGDGELTMMEEAFRIVGATSPNPQYSNGNLGPRDRVTNGFESDSDEGLRGARRSAGIEDLAGLAAVRVKLETDEVDSDSERDGLRASAAPSGAEGSGSGSNTGKRGGDEVNGDLLDPSGPPRKKKKPRQSAPASINGSLRVNSGQRGTSASTGSTSGSSSRRPGSVQPATNAWTDIYSSSIHSLMSSLPSADIQRILFDTFFTDPFLNEGITLLQPQFMEDLKSLTERNGQSVREGDATTLANAFAILGTALRIMPSETSHLLLASSGGLQGQLQPRSLSRILSPHLSSSPDPTPLDQRYFDLALLCSQMAESGDSPSVMLVMLKLVLYRNLAIRKDRNVIAGQYLGGAIRVAQALGMGKEWEGIPQGERELRRRVMWCLYIADRHLSFETAFPYTILDAHQGIHLPSPISEADLYKIAQDAQSLPPHSTEVGPTACTALFIHTHLARRITPILDSFATISPSHTPHDLVLRFDQSLDNFQDALPPYMRLFPGTDTRFDSSHSYLAAHRIRLHARILAYRQGVHRSFVTTYLRPSAPAGIRGVMANICLSSLRTQRSAKMLDPKIAPRIFEPLVVFESAMILGMILYVDKAISGGKGAGAEGMMWREGLANGVELLDHISGGVDVARKAVKVLREMCAKIDLPVAMDSKPFAFDISGPNGSPPPPEPAQPQRPSTSRVTAVDSWLDGMIKERRSLEVLLKDPQWEGAWEYVLAAM